MIQKKKGVSFLEIKVGTPLTSESWRWKLCSINVGDTLFY